MALDTQFPAWLRDQQNFMMESGERSTQNFVQSLFEGQKLQMEQKQNQLALASRMLGIEQQEQQLDLGKIQMGNYAHDSQTIPQWLQEHPTWESRHADNTQWPTALSPQGQKQLDQVRMQDASSVQQKAAVSAISEFSKRVDALSKSDPIAAGQFAPYIGKANPSPEILQALGLAEQAVGVRQQNEKEQAEMAAAARGDTATTRITPKGVETTYKPAPVGSKSFKPEEPIKLQDGAQLIHVSPNRWQYVKGDTRKDLTPEQRRNVAHELLTINAQDPRGLKILNELADMADKSAKSDTTTTPSTNTFKVGDFNVKVK